MADQSIVSIVSPIIAATAIALSILTTRRAARTARAQLTIDIWKVWSSRDYRRSRVTAYRALQKAKADGSAGAPPKMAILIADTETEDAVGSIEHFIVEIAPLVRRGLLDRKLFRSLFQHSLSAWHDALSGFDRFGTADFEHDELNLAFTAMLGANGRLRPLSEWPSAIYHALLRPPQ